MRFVIVVGLQLVDGLPFYQDKLYDANVFQCFEDVLVSSSPFPTLLTPESHLFISISRVFFSLFES